MRLSYFLQMRETFKNTLDLIPNGVLIMSTDENKITFANKEMHSLVGATVNIPKRDENGESSDEEYSSDLTEKLTDFQLQDFCHS